MIDSWVNTYSKIINYSFFFFVSLWCRFMLLSVVTTSSKKV